MPAPEKTICFVSCVNDEELYEKCLYYLAALNVPEGMEVEYKALRGATSMCAGYNQAMEESRAKYKVYLHQDTFIINPYFIQQIIDIFKDERIGLLGMIGSLTLPESFCWWESRHLCGRVSESSKGYLAELNFRPPKEIRNDRTWQEVIAVDGLLMATQYDLPWREDLFRGWHFYDTAHSLEFERAGYLVAVAVQHWPWVCHDCGIASLYGYDEAREVFATEYDAEVMAQRQEFEADLKRFKKRLRKERFCRRLIRCLPRSLRPKSKS